jgi:predicted DNA-binding transcriptional regulator AlpA
MTVELLTMDDLSSLLHAPVGTLRHWRLTGQGPKSAKIGRRVLYRSTDVQKWLDQYFSG